MSAPGGRNERRERRERIIAALLAHPTHEAAVAALGIGISTLRRYLADPAFVRAYRAARRRLVEAAVGRLQAAAGKAVEALERNLTCGKAADEIRAALGILDHAHRGLEVMDVAERLEAVERALRGSP